MRSHVLNMPYTDDTSEVHRSVFGKEKTWQDHIKDAGIFGAEQGQEMDG